MLEGDHVMRLLALVTTAAMAVPSAALAATPIKAPAQRFDADYARLFANAKTACAIIKAAPNPMPERTVNHLVDLSNTYKSMKYGLDKRLRRAGYRPSPPMKSWSGNRAFRYWSGQIRRSGCPS